MKKGIGDGKQKGLDPPGILVSGSRSEANHDVIPYSNSIESDQPSMQRLVNRFLGKEACTVGFMLSFSLIPKEDNVVKEGDLNATIAAKEKKCK